MSEPVVDLMAALKQSLADAGCMTPLERALENLERANAEAERFHAAYLRLQEAVCTETTSLPDVRRRILAVCDPDGVA